MLQTKEVFLCLEYFVVNLTLLCFSDHVASKDWLVVNSEFERMWKEVAMAWFEVLLWNLHGGTEEDHEVLKSG